MVNANPSTKIGRVDIEKEFKEFGVHKTHDTTYFRSFEKLTRDPNGASQRTGGNIFTGSYYPSHVINLGILKDAPSFSRRSLT